MQSNELAREFFLLVLSIITWIFLSMLLPYFSVILWAVTLAIIFHPIKNRIKVIIGQNLDGIAALLTTIAICLIVFIPLMIIISSLVIELNSIYSNLQHNNSYFSDVINKLFNFLPIWIRSFLSEHNIDNVVQVKQKISEIVLKTGQYLVGSIFLIGKGTFGFATSFSVMLYLIFFLLKDGLYLAHRIINNLPLSNFIKQNFFIKFAVVIRTIVKGTVAVAAIQGTLGGIALYIINIDGSILWGTLIACFSVVPAIGSVVIWLPITVYLFITHKFLNGIFIVSCFLLFTGLVDNFLRPILVSKNTNVPDYLMLLTTLSSIEIHGINGFIIGPIIAVLFTNSWSLFFSNKYIDNNKNISEN